MAVSEALAEFPLHGLLPKRETQVESFLRKYPSFDGRNTLIAIFDSGVDPGASGLSKTSTGQRKIIDVIDCSGCGDVDTSTVVTVNCDGTLDGITGRKLKIPESWSNPSGEFHIGCKRLFSLFPQSLLQRIKKENKTEVWDPPHKIAVAEATRNLCDFEKKQGTKDKSEEEILIHENLKATVDVLRQIDEKYDDCGPVYDCIVFNDGNGWRVCIDTSEEGNLEDCSLLTPFKVNGEFSRFSDKDMMNYAVDVMENGNLLSIITNSSSHGTHVASIAAAYFPDKPELNGIAPGAQVISMQIGDNRMDGMETGSALIRAMMCAIERGVDVINLSYGEASKWANSGRVVEMMNKLVTEHDIIFVSSAGNSGPALSTVGAPGGTAKHVIGIGAYVSPDMMSAEYSLLEKVPGNQYTWSSVGPSLDGALGVCITAPGGAITSVPNWTLSKSQLMNGTSMSSPSACGGIAVLLSALKAENIQYSPRSIRRCLENTASKIDGISVLVQGHGLLQVDKAFEYMKEINEDMSAKFISYDISCGINRGIYIREFEQHNMPEKFHVEIKPNFHKRTENDLKIQFDEKLCLVSTEPWVTCPSHLNLYNAGRSIAVVVRKNGLSPGVHCAEVIGYNEQALNLGAVFRIPVTVIIPENIDRKQQPTRSFSLQKLSFKPGTRIRKFYFIPQGVTWAELTVKSNEKERDIRYAIHAVQLGAEQAFIENEFVKFALIKANSENTEFRFPIKAGCTLELCISRWWTFPGDSELSLDVTFHSLLPESSSLFLNGNVGYTSVLVTNQYGMEEIDPNASLTHHIIPVAPKQNLIKPLGVRDLLPDGEQIYALEMTYNFTLAKAGKLIPIVPRLYDLLYESPYENQLWMCYNNNKYLQRSGDAYSIKYKYTCNLEKGDHEVRLQIRHSDVGLLNTLKDTPINLRIEITEIKLDVFAARKDIYDQKKKFRSRILTNETQCPVYITCPPEDKLPKGVKPGHQLVGEVKYSKKKESYPLVMTIGQPKCSTDDKSNDNKEEKQIEDQYKAAHEEFLAQWIGKVQGSTLEDELTQQLGDGIHGKNALLNALDGSKTRTTNLPKIILTAKEVIEQVDQVKLLSYFAVKTHIDTSDQKNKEDMEKEKNVLINAIYKMGLAVADGILGTNKTDDVITDTDASGDAGREESTEYQVEDLNSCYRTLAKFTDKNDAKMQMLTVRHSMVRKNFGKALSTLLTYFQENNRSKEYDAFLIELVDSLRYPHLVQYFKRWSLVRFPAAYELF